jgi:hypothetical protein
MKAGICQPDRNGHQEDLFPLRFQSYTQCVPKVLGLIFQNQNIHKEDK